VATRDGYDKNLVVNATKNATGLLASDGNQDGFSKRVLRGCQRAKRIGDLKLYEDMLLDMGRGDIIIP